MTSQPGFHIGVTRTGKAALSVTCPVTARDGARTVTLLVIGWWRGATRAGGDNRGEETLMAPVIAAGLALLILVLSTRYVPAGHAGLVERSGSYRRTLRRRVGWVV